MQPEAKQEEGDWAVITEMKASTEEKLKVTQWVTYFRYKALKST